MLFPELLFYEDFDNSGRAGIVGRISSKRAGKSGSALVRFSTTPLLRCPRSRTGLQIYQTYASSVLTEMYPFEKLPLPKLTDSEVADLLAFLGALTAPSARELDHVIPASVPSGLALVDPFPKPESD